MCAGLRLGGSEDEQPMVKFESWAISRSPAQQCQPHDDSVQNVPTEFATVKMAVE